MNSPSPGPRKYPPVPDTLRETLELVRQGPKITEQTLNPASLGPVPFPDGLKQFRHEQMRVLQRTRERLKSDDRYSDEELKSLWDSIGERIAEDLIDRLPPKYRARVETEHVSAVGAIQMRGTLYLLVKVRDPQTRDYLIPIAPHITAQSLEWCGLVLPLDAERGFLTLPERSVRLSPRAFSYLICPAGYPTKVTPLARALLRGSIADVAYAVDDPLPTPRNSIVRALPAPDGTEADLVALKDVRPPKIEEYFLSRSESGYRVGRLHLDDRTFQVHAEARLFAFDSTPMNRYSPRESEQNAMQTFYDRMLDEPWHGYSICEPSEEKRYSEILEKALRRNPDPVLGLNLAVYHKVTTVAACHRLDERGKPIAALLVACQGAENRYVTPLDYDGIAATDAFAGQIVLVSPHRKHAYMPDDSRHLSKQAFHEMAFQMLRPDAFPEFEYHLRRFLLHTAQEAFGFPVSEISRILMDHPNPDTYRFLVKHYGRKICPQTGDSPRDARTKSVPRLTLLELAFDAGNGKLKAPKALAHFWEPRLSKPDTVSLQ